MTPVIETEELTHRFGREEKSVVAVDGVSLQIGAGEFVLLRGPSGSGKTTLLALLGCLLRPTSGRLQILGQDVAALPSRALAGLRTQTIGFVFQGFNLLANLKVWENVALVGDFLSDRPQGTRSRAVDLLRDVGLGHRIDYLPANLSAGEKQRVAFARALLNRPPIILADEPTANLDAANRTVIADLLRRAVDQQNVSVVVATHDDRLQPWADRVIHIEDGKLGGGNIDLARMKGTQGS
ncbi:MAG: ABC transporter ATP-binding protein [Deltaproteobacteria bacterium]|nr:ABC transporter ATP-binding protein [Deltaproteobacteria bacterium]